VTKSLLVALDDIVDLDTSKSLINNSIELVLKDLTEEVLVSVEVVLLSLLDLLDLFINFGDIDLMIWVKVDDFLLHLGLLLW